MKRSFIFAAFVAATLAFSAVVLSQTNLEARGLQGKPTVPVKKRVLGTVMSIDTVAKEIVVKSKKAMIPFEIDGSTTVMINGKHRKVSDIQLNCRITVIYRRNGHRKLALFLMTSVVDRPSVDKETKTPSLL